MFDLLRLYGDRMRSHRDRDATARIHTNACTEPGGAAAASGVFRHGEADGIVRHVASLLDHKVDFYQILPFCVGISTFLRGLGASAEAKAGLGCKARRGGQPGRRGLGLRGLRLLGS